MKLKMHVVIQKSKNLKKITIKIRKNITINNYIELSKYFFSKSRVYTYLDHFTLNLNINNTMLVRYTK